MKTDSSEKLQKVLARAGLGSRREIEQWIRDGRIKVNKDIAHIGERVNLKDKISVDNRQINILNIKDAPQKILCYHKPAGEVCTRNDPEKRKTIFDNLPPLKRARWINVGRLDFNTSGLLLLTTDGELANRLMHPSSNIEREYAVRILGEVNLDMIKRLTEGVQLEDGMAKFKSIKEAGGSGANHWYHVILTEGRNREVRRLWESQDVTVSRLIRIRFGAISLPPRLRVGKYVELDEQSKRLLLKSVKH